MRAELYSLALLISGEKKKKEVFLKIILITKCSSSLQNLPIADWLQNTGQTSYLLCKSWALRKQITN